MDLMNTVNRVIAAMNFVDPVEFLKGLVGSGALSPEDGWLVLCAVRQIERAHVRT